MLNKLFVKLLMLLPAEMAHQFAIRALHYWGKCLGPKQRVCHPQEIFNLHFANPVGLAAGFDKDGIAIDGLSRLGFGFIEIGTLTPKPQAGQKKPRLFRLPAKTSLINRMGFNNCGVDVAIKHIKASRYRGILGINIGKNASTSLDKAVDDYVNAMTEVYPYASYITINISSPNTEQLRNLQHGAELINLLSQLKKLQQQLQHQYQRYVPLVVKLAPDLQDIEIQSIAQILLQQKIDGVIATNTSLGRDGVEGCQNADQAGGLSGSTITSLSTRVIQQLSQALKGQIPIIAAGGIMSARDAQEKLAAGASLVQIYTGFIYRGPELIDEILQQVTFNSSSRHPRISAANVREPGKF